MSRGRGGARGLIPIQLSSRAGIDSFISTVIHEAKHVGLFAMKNLILQIVIASTCACALMARPRNIAIVHAVVENLKLSAGSPPEESKIPGSTPIYDVSLKIDKVFSGKEALKGGVTANSCPARPRQGSSLNSRGWLRRRGATPGMSPLKSVGWGPGAPAGTGRDGKPGASLVPRSTPGYSWKTPYGVDPGHMSWRSHP
jgi:hypothetical protein